MASNKDKVESQVNELPEYESIAETEAKQENRFLARLKKNPFVTLGVVGGVGAVAYNFYQMKNRKTKLSVYLIETRVKAQATVIGCVLLGVIYSMYTDFRADDKSKTH